MSLHQQVNQPCGFIFWHTFFYFFLHEIFSVITIISITAFHRSGDPISAGKSLVLAK
jgi:hypothetical protein